MFNIKIILTLITLSVSALTIAVSAKMIPTPLDNLKIPNVVFYKDTDKSQLIHLSIDNMNNKAISLKMALNVKNQTKIQPWKINYPKDLELPSNTEILFPIYVSPRNKENLNLKKELLAIEILHDDQLLKTIPFVKQKPDVLRTK
jgi:hypothetical protein